MLKSVKRFAGRGDRDLDVERAVRGHRSRFSGDSVGVGRVPVRRLFGSGRRLRS
jgi:hypothetical protein